MAIISSALAKINRDPLAVLGGAERVNQVFEQVGHRWRERQLNPATTVALFIVQVLNGNTAIEHLRHLTGRAMSASSYRTRALTIATTLLDPARYPKHEIARLYGLRWQVETHFRELKQTLKMDMLKCKSTDGVIKELMIYLLVYNLVRMMMLAAARRQRVPVDRISFIDAWRFLLGRLTGRGLLPLRTNPYRPGRWQPRVLKRRMKEYDLMTRPRWQYPQPSPEPTFTD